MKPCPKCGAQIDWYVRMAGHLKMAHGLDWKEAHRVAKELQA